MRYPSGIAEDILGKIRNFFATIDFVILDMDVDTRTPLILGRPFLSTANVNIDVRARDIQLINNECKEKFAFRPKIETKKKQGSASILAIKSITEAIEALKLQ